MGKRRIIIAVLSALLLGSGFTVGSPTARAEHLPEPQQSPCRPSAPAGETVLGYSDDGPQDDPRRSLPTLYYNETDPEAPYIGACSGGSAGEPIRYIELRLTPGGPYVYASNASGGLAVGQCLPPPFTFPKPTCAAVTSPSGDARDLSATATASTYQGDSSECGECYRETITTRTATVSQDGVVLETVAVTWRYTPGGEETSTSTQRFFVKRSPDGRVALGSEDGACYNRIEDDLSDAAPPTYGENPSSNCVGVSGTLATATYEVERAKAIAQSWAEFVLSRVPAAPPTGAACRPTPAAGEVLVPTPASSPVIVYANPTATPPYAGACTGGANGEPIRYVEVRSTPAGPFVAASDGTTGYVVGGCLEPESPIFVADVKVHGCAAALALQPGRPAGVYLELGQTSSARTESSYVFLSPAEVIVGESQSFGYGEYYYQERFIRRGENGHIQIGEEQGDPPTCSWSDYDMANPTAPPTHHAGEYEDCYW